MDKSSATDYIYAKSQGMLAKSFVGPRKIRLFSAKSLSELWRMLFDTASPLVPENLLAKTIEQEAEKAFIYDYMKLLSAFNDPDPVAVQLLRFYDYQNIKEVNAALMRGFTEIPKIVDIGRYSILHYKGWPKVDLITKNTSISWLESPPTRETILEIDTRLDIQYTTELWKACKVVTGPDKESVEYIIKEYIVLQNILWALRLKIYYNFNEKQMLEHLVFDGNKPNHSDILAGPAIEAFNKQTDSWEDWDSWKYVDFINPNEEGTVWNLDPTWLQNSINLHLNKVVYSSFGMHFSSAHILVTWFKLKEYELNCIRTCVEGLRLNVETEEAKQFTWIYQ